MKKKVWYFIAAMVIVSGVALTSAFTSETSSNEETLPQEHIVIDIYEVPDYDLKGIHVHMGPGKTEVYPFKEFKQENHDDNGELLVKVLNELSRKGYEIISTSTGKAQSGVITKIFMRRKD